MTKSWQVWKDYWCNCGPISGALSIFENIHSNQTGGGSDVMTGLVSAHTVMGLDLHEVPDYVIVTITLKDHFSPAIVAHVDLDTLTADGFDVLLYDPTNGMFMNPAGGDIVNYIYGWNP